MRRESCRTCVATACPITEQRARVNERIRPSPSHACSHRRLIGRWPPWLSPRAVQLRRRRRNSRHRLAPARREEELYRRRDHRRLLEDRVRRRISSRRPRRPHPEIRRAGAGVRRRRRSRRPQGATRQGRRRYRPARSASRHRHGRQQRRAPMSSSIWCATAICPHHHQLLRQRTRQARFAPRSIRNACPDSARTKTSKSSIPT